MDQVTRKRFDNLERRLDAIEVKLSAQNAEVVESIDALKTETTNAFRDLNVRLTTEIHTVLGALTDVKNFLVERDTMKQRFEAMEAKLNALTAKVEGRGA